MSLKDRLVELIESHEPFMVYALPGDSQIEIIHGNNCDKGTIDCNKEFHFQNQASSVNQRVSKAVIRTWEGEKVSIPSSDSFNNFIKAYPPIGDVPVISHDEYIRRLGQVIVSLQESGGKVVVSRAKKMPSAKFEEICAALERMFADSVRAFRFIYYTPKTGFWAGATPELLLKFDKTDGKISTMALAGTRKADIYEQWDAKNIKEHQFVVEYIIDKLSELGIKVCRGATTTVAVGNISHLMTPISGYAPSIDPMDLADALHPTPAIAGKPVDTALAVIRETEVTPRRCYGGYIAIETEKQWIAFVNLRCMTFDATGRLYYGGGGITSNSTAESEWQETELKIKSTACYF